jgi:hypothetical protein
VASGCVGEEIPGVAFGNEAEGVDDALDWFATGLVVEEGELAVEGEGVLHDGEGGEVFGGAAPASGVDVEALADGSCLVAERGGEGSH